MPASIHIDQDFSIGDAWFASSSPAGNWAIVFEDDGNTGYFYACRIKPDGAMDGIVDALQIYNVKNVVDRDRPSRLQIAWTESGLVAMLLINQYAHAAIDFASKRAVCRTGFPPANGDFAQSHDWDPQLIEQFRWS